MVVAKLRTSHSLGRMWLEAYSSGFLNAADARVTGRQQGGQLRLESFPAAAACLNGMKFGGYAVAHTGWGLNREPGPVRQKEALRDLAIFKSSLQLLACCLGTWPVSLVVTQIPEVF